MKELPILFSTPMVQAIIEGRKTETRRLKGLKIINKNPDEWTKDFNDAKLYKSCFNGNGQFIVKCSYQIGDILYVRESFAYKSFSTLGYGVIYKADNSIMENIDDDSINIETCFNREYKYSNWKPSIHMPKSASRIWLQIKTIGIERLQDISEADSINEGIEHWPNPFLKGIETYQDYSKPVKKGTNGGFTTASTAFSVLWSHINGPESWHLNPWVWVIKFKVLSTTGRPVTL